MIQIKHLIWYLKKYYLLFLIFPLTIAVVVFLLTAGSPKIYDSHMVIYTGISTRKNADLTESLKIDFFTSNNLMDNIISLISSRKSIEEVSLRLLSQHLSLEEPELSVLSPQSAEELKLHISDNLKSQVAVVGNPEQTLSNILSYMEDNYNSPFHYLLEHHPHYGVDEILQKVQVTRKKNSDMIEISYYQDDAGIVYHTVKFLGEVYLKRYSELRYNETASSVEYFQSQLEVVLAELNESEQKLKDFISKNRIMNYYEQGKSLDLYRKEVEADQSNAYQLATGAEAGLIKLEERLKENIGRSDILDSISSLRKHVSQLRVKLNTREGRDTWDAEQIKDEISKANEAINLKVSRLYQQDFSVDGVPMNDILQEWLKLYIEKEKQFTASDVMLNDLKRIDQRIDTFAPLGAELNRLEREVSIHEKEYLAIITGLNQARIQKENFKLSQSQVVVDPPYLPSNARKSKRKILVIASFLFGNILVLSFITILLITDSSLQNPKRAEEITGLTLAGTFPSMDKSKDPKLNKVVFEYWLNELNLRRSQNKNKSPYLIGMLLDEENKSNLGLIQSLAGNLEKEQVRTQILHPGVIPAGIPYTETAYHRSNSPMALGIGQNSLAEGFDIVIIIHPYWKEQHISFDILQACDWNLMIIDAEVVWKPNYSKFVDMIQSSTRLKPDMLLSNVDSIFVKEYTGA
ncbi:hypothetical protein LZF95_03525 [Algoriphagus sp. AGSA1]|uniref:GumC family protein n=1 Tax=Algoriphagus sp. AGSA1 TaxID=2907213 RepID=UPI001F3FFD2E|nr:hypothetical protein [Algoriphagus sp. AGSA1]MCE7053735.1 hypothetical protein [Algoriphagus sp. AGSA1]